MRNKRRELTVLVVVADRSVPRRAETGSSHTPIRAMPRGRRLSAHDGGRKYDPLGTPLDITMPFIPHNAKCELSKRTAVL